MQVETYADAGQLQQALIAEIRILSGVLGSGAGQAGRSDHLNGRLLNRLELLSDLVSRGIFVAGLEETG